MTAGHDASPAASPQTVGADEYRHVLGHFCTGVTVITTVDDEGPAGFTCQSFGALSLDPPLVLFCPSLSSSTGRRVMDAGRFCANVLAGSQRALARGFASKAADKFAGVGWSPSPSGAPVLDGALTWVDCAVEAVHEAGDHYVVLGRVTGLGECGPGRPLLFYRGRYGVTAGEPTDGLPEIVDTLLAWPRHADWM